MTAEFNGPARPPESRLGDTVDVIHGVEVPDPYRWLEDRQSEETAAWIDAQNRYSASLIEELPCFEPIKQRLAGLGQRDTAFVPFVRSGLHFFDRRLKGEERRSICVRRDPHGPDEVLLKPEDVSADPSVNVSFVAVSHDSRYLAYSKRKGGEDEDEIHILNLESRTELPDVVAWGNHYGHFTFTRDGSGYLYRTQKPEGLRVYRHTIGTPPETDHEVFGDVVDRSAWILISESFDGRYVLYAVAHGTHQTDLYIQDANALEPARPLIQGLDARVGYGASLRPPSATCWPLMNDRLYFRTDWQASNRRILALDLARPEPENWIEIVPECESALDEFALIDGRLFVHYIENVASRTKVFDLKGKQLGKVSLPSLGTASNLQGAQDGDEVLFSFTSFTTPSTTYRYEISTGSLEAWLLLDLSGEDETIETHQEWYSSSDGTRVPMFIVNKRGLERNSANPTVLYGYGGSGISMTPRFNRFALEWIELGGVFALANIRGGGEFGEKWHRSGVRAQGKQKSFDDFTAAAEFLIDKNYTSRSKLAIQGASGGGLLVAAVMNQRPDLFQAVLCEFPVLDLIRWAEFARDLQHLPEDGDVRDPAQFPFVMAYSPYHNVKDGAEYPAVLLTTGDSDTRCPPL